MKSMAFVALFALPALVCAQQVKMPQSALMDGVSSESAGINLAPTLWNSPSGIAAYAVSGDGYQDPLSPGKTDVHLGNLWQAQAPASIGETIHQLDETGGTLRVIFVGETAGWNNSFGYAYSGDPEASSSFTVWNKIATTGTAQTVSFGDHFDVHLSRGSWSKFDLWFSCAGVMGEPPSSKTALGGIYTLFHNASDQSLWAQEGIAQNTQNGSSNPDRVNTFLISFEDWRLNSGADCDYSDLRIALQFYNPDGSAFVAVPEPGSAALFIGSLTALVIGFKSARNRIRRGSPFLNPSKHGHMTPWPPKGLRWIWR